MGSSADKAEAHYGRADLAVLRYHWQRRQMWGCETLYCQVSDPCEVAAKTLWCHPGHRKIASLSKHKNLEMLWAMCIKSNTLLELVMLKNNGLRQCYWASHDLASSCVHYPEEVRWFYPDFNAVKWSTKTLGQLQRCLWDLDLASGRIELCVPGHHIMWSLVMMRARSCRTASIWLPRTGGSSNSSFQRHCSFRGCCHCSNRLQSFCNHPFYGRWCHTTSHETFL